MWHRRKPLSRKKVTIKELAEHYGVHRNTMSRRVGTIFSKLKTKEPDNEVSLYNIWSVIHLVNELDREYRRGLWDDSKAINSQ